MDKFSAKNIVNVAIDTINGKYGKVWYRRYNAFQNDGYEYNVGKYHDGIWSFDCLGFVHTMVNGFSGDKTKLGGGAVMDDFVNMSDEPTTLNKYCSVRGTFPKKDCKPASLLKMDGHVGLFVGERTENGQMINSAEVTMSMGGGGKFSWVDLTNGNRYNCKGGTYLGTWTNWGEFDRVDYSSSKTTTTKKTTTQKIAQSATKKGIDISHHNGTIDFAKVKSAGISFIIPRDGWGEENTDTKFFEYVKQAQSARIEVPGVYHFVYAKDKDQVILNAKKAIENVVKAGLPKTTIIWCDLEYDTVDNARDYRGTVLSVQAQKEFVETFCDYILSQGYPTGAYVNQDFMSRVFGAAFGNKYDLWVADYEGDCAYKCVYRQTGASSSIAGINGNVDTDEYYGQFTAGTAKPKSGVAPTTTTKKVQIPVETESVSSLTIAIQILAGQWGNNPERKNKITAKYGATVYNEAQAYVNKILNYELYVNIAVGILEGKFGNNPNRKKTITSTYGSTAYSVAQGYVNDGLSKNDLENGYRIAVEIIQGKWGNNPERQTNITNRYGAKVFNLAQNIVNNIFK